MCGLFQGFGQLPAIVSPWYDNGDINTYLKAREGDPDLDVVKLSLVRLVCKSMTRAHRRILAGASFDWLEISFVASRSSCRADGSRSA